MEVSDGVNLLFCLLSRGVKIVSDLRSGGLIWSKFAFLHFFQGVIIVSDLRSEGVSWSKFVFAFSSFVQGGENSI